MKDESENHSSPPEGPILRRESDNSFGIVPSVSTVIQLCMTKTSRYRASRHNPRGKGGGGEAINWP